MHRRFFWLEEPPGPQDRTPRSKTPGFYGSDKEAWIEVDWSRREFPLPDVKAPERTNFDT